MILSNGMWHNVQISVYTQLRLFFLSYIAVYHSPQCSLLSSGLILALIYLSDLWSDHFSDYVLYHCDLYDCQLGRRAWWELSIKTVKT